jgi:hypothetical protein
MAEDVVFPCVPATTRGDDLARNSSESAAGMETIRSPFASAASASAFVRRTALPHTTRSTPSSRAGSYPERTGMPSSSSSVLAGG